MRTSYLLALMLCVLPVLISRCAAATPPSTHITLQFIGNSCTLITAPDGTRIVSDPYGEFEHPAGMDRLPEDLKATTVTVSHAHPDHNNVEAAGGTPQLIMAPGTYQVGIVKVTGYEGSPTGPSTMPHIIFVFEIRSVKVVHRGARGPSHSLMS